jgi:hypothetical protein
MSSKNLNLQDTASRCPLLSALMRADFGEMVGSPSGSPVAGVGEEEAAEVPHAATSQAAATSALAADEDDVHIASHGSQPHLHQVCWSK